MNDEIDNFKAELKTIGNSQWVLIPKNICTFAGLQEKDTVKIWIKKIQE